MDIALIGPSGSGKGTHIDTLIKEFGFLHLGPGELFRRHIQNQTELGLAAQRYIDQGELAPDGLVDAMIEAEVSKVPSTTPILFDGFPATLDQAHFLDALLANSGRQLGAVIYLDVIDETLQKQIAGRLICRRCQASFHETQNPFKLCPHSLCQGEDLYRREDDAPEVSRHRLDAYYRKIATVIDHYDLQGKLCVIDGNGLISWIDDDLIETIKAIRMRMSNLVANSTVNRTSGVRSAVRKPTETYIRPSLDLVLFGPPGSGKGTQAEILSEQFDIPHITTGDLFRENLAQGSALGKIAKGYIERGELVPDDITEGMIQQRFSSPDTEKGFILDGYPRTLHQAEALTRMSQALHRHLTGVIHLDIPDTTIIARLSDRLTCRDCQAVYHRFYHPPAQTDICDKCGGELYQRIDDDPEVIRMRLQTFHRRTDPVLDYYRHLGVLMTVEGEGDISVVSKRLLSAIEQLKAANPLLPQTSFA